MSKEIDERIVSMKFDNQQFENGTKASIKSLNDLKKGLDLGNSAKSLSNLQETGKNFSLGNIANGVSSISSKFSALGVVGITALQNITNSAINAGTQMVKSLTVEPIMEGLTNYETKINSIQTILANTSAKGTTLSQVTKALAELNTYANKTVYNFADMTKNIGTFTAAGVDLKTSISSIKGIANLAAMSGSSSAQASTAMYQLSQAIASGSVKLQDWNSVNSAGMGGMGFQQALERTARAHGVAIDKMIKKQGSFRETLKSGWITSDILTETLSQYTGDLSAAQLKSMGYSEKQAKDILAMGKTANDSATKIRTMTQMTQALKEEVGTAWATIWEDLFGNINQATDMFTKMHNTLESALTNVIYGLDGLLKKWAKLGGRDEVINGITNAFKGLNSILEPIKEAFNEVFPAITAQQLINITKGFENLTAKFKIGSGTANDLRSTFKGLFAALDIVRQAFGAVAGGAFMVLKAMSPLFSEILKLTGSFGNWIYAIDKSLAKNKTLAGIVSTVLNMIKNLGGGIKTLASSLEGFGHIDLSGFQRFGNAVADTDVFKTEPVVIFINTMKRVGTVISEVYQKIKPGLTLIGNAFKNTFSNIGKNIGNVGKNLGAGGIVSLVGSLIGLFARLRINTILKSVDGTIKSIDGAVKNAGAFTNNINKILTGVTKSLEAFTNDIKANTLLKIAAAIAILAASLVVISSIPTPKLLSSLGAIGALFTALFGSMGIFQKIAGGKSFKNVDQATLGMLAVSRAILMLSMAMETLAKLSWEGIAKGVSVITYLSAMLVIVAKTMAESSKKMISSSIGLILFAGAIDSLANTVKKVGAIDTVSLIKGLAGVAIMIAEVVGFMKLTSSASSGIGKGFGLMEFAIAIGILSKTVATFATLNPVALATGLAGVATLLAEIALFVGATGDSKKVISTAIGMQILGIAMIEFAKAVSMIGKLSAAELAKGLIGFAGSLAIVAVALSVMPDPKQFLGKSVGILIIANAMVILAGALRIMGKMSVGEVAKSLITLAGSLGIIAIAIKLMPSPGSFLAKSAGMLIIANAMVLLAGALRIMGGMSVAGVAKSLIALGGALTIIVIAMKLMPGALLGAAALLIISAAIVVLATGLKILGSMSVKQMVTALIGLAAAITILGVASAILAPIFPAMLGLAGVLAVLGLSMLAFGTGVKTFAVAMALLGSMSGDKILNMTTVLRKVIDLIPTVFTKLAEGIADFADTLAQRAPKISNDFVILVTSFVTAITKTIPKVVNAINEMFTQMLKSIAKHMPRMMKAGADIIFAILDGINKNIGRITKKGIDICANFIEAIGSELPKIIQAGFNLIINFINGLATAIRKNTPRMVKAINNLISAMIDSAVYILTGGRPKFKKAGKNAIDGFVAGLISRVGAVNHAVVGLGAGALATLLHTLGIKSPSKEFAKIGMYAALGFAVGLSNFGGTAAASAANMGKSAMASLSSSVSKISDVVNTNMDFNPTISPVIDLTNIKSGAKTMSSLLSQNHGVTTLSATNKANSISSTMNSGSSSQNGVSNGSQTVKHEGTIHVEGVNNQGELTGVVDIIIDKLRKEGRT